MSNPVTLPSSNFYAYWLLSYTLPFVIFSNLPETVVLNCLDLQESCFGHSACFFPIQQDWLHIRVEGPQCGTNADVSWGPDVLQHGKWIPFRFLTWCHGLFHPVCPPHLDKGLNLSDRLTANCDWCLVSGVDLHQFFFSLSWSCVPFLRCCCKVSCFVLHLTFCKRRVKRSSSKLRSLSCARSVYYIPLFLPDVLVLMISLLPGMCLAIFPWCAASPVKMLHRNERICYAVG